MSQHWNNSTPWNPRYDLGPELPPPDWYEGQDDPQPDPPPDEDP